MGSAESKLRTSLLMSVACRNSALKLMLRLTFNAVVIFQLLAQSNGFTILANGKIRNMGRKISVHVAHKSNRISQPSALMAANSAFLALHNDSSYCLSSLFVLAGLGISLERRTVIGKALSAPLATMAAALSIANLGALPFSSPVYTAVNVYAVPLAVPLLLFDSNLKRVLADTGGLLAAFGVGAFATVVGTVSAMALLPKTPVSCACALAARHIGGAINFVAVAETLRIPATTVSAAIAADNVVVAFYFALLFALSKGEKKTEDMLVLEEVPEEDRSDISLSTMSAALATSAALVSVGKALTRSFLPSETSSLPLTSILTVLGATIFSDHFSALSSSGSALGVWLIQLFFAASGASGSIGLVIKTAPLLFVFSVVQILCHFSVLIGVGRWLFRLPPKELYLASNANVGGPTTAAAMAQAKGWKKLVLPALMVGILGYATATPIALGLEPILRQIARLK